MPLTAQAEFCVAAYVTAPDPEPPLTPSVSVDKYGTDVPDDHDNADEGLQEDDGHRGHRERR